MDATVGHVNPISAENRLAADISTDTAVATGRPETADVAALRTIRERMIRQYRLNGTLSRMVRRLVGDRAEPPVELSPTLHTATAAQHPLRRTATSDPWWPGGPVEPALPLDPPPGHDCEESAGSIREVVGVSVTGLHGADLEQVIAEITETQLRERLWAPVFITDQPDFRAFASRGHAFEYLGNFRGFLEARGQDENKVRMSILARKWGITRIVERDGPGGIDTCHPALARHNAGMSQACQSDRFRWAIGTLGIALSTERYDIVEGLAAYILAFYADFDDANRLAATRALCRKFVAFGEIDRLRRLLLENIEHARKDDALFTWFTVHCTPASCFSPELARLPSGKVNSYYVSSRMAGAGEHAVASLLTLAGEGHSGTSLLLANYFAQRRDAALYRSCVNGVIARDGRPALREFRFEGENILSRFAFEAGRSDRGGELVSVIMSAYNAAETIAYAARSILEQTHSNLELLICDDCSTDGTLEGLAELRCDPRIRCFRSAERQGTYNIRNNLIRLARGTCLTFQDADDFAFADRIERQLAFLRQERAAAVVGEWYRVTRDGEFIFSPDQAVARIATVSLFAPKVVFERFGPYRAARFGADTEFYESVRMQLGPDAVKRLALPIMFGLASASSLTRSAGIEATEDGFRAPARRAYAAAAARVRQIGRPEARSLDDVLSEQGNLMPDAGVLQLEIQSP
jgi:hypothetical protein